jgi:hypothetical protein
MTEDRKGRAREVVRAELELLVEFLGAVERGGNERFLSDLPFDEVEGPRELAKRIREGSLTLVFR